MKSPRIFAIFTVIFLLIGSVAWAQSSDPAGAIVTLYSHDPLAHTFSFTAAQYGSIVQGYEIKNKGSDIEFDSYQAGSFTAGIEGGTLASFTDLGDEAELAQSHGITQTVGGGQAFASLRTIGQKVLIGGQRNNEPREVTGTKMFFTTARASTSLPVRIGHVYLLKITDARDKSTRVTVKLLVTAHRPGESVTFRWQTL